MFTSNTNKTATVKHQKILFCVLNWGIGHATRSAVLIKKLIEQENNITIASDGDALQLLQKEFPNLPTVNLPAYNIEYAKKPFFNLSILLQVPKLMKAIHAEKQIVSELEHEYDMIISDNRYGCYSSKIPSVFLSHQLNIQTPYSFLSSWVNILHRRHLALFGEIWIPDDERNLSGELSVLSWSKPVTKIGILSGFSPIPELKKNIDVLIILSGPEPARTVFETALLEHYKKVSSKKIILVGGTPTALNKIENQTFQYLPYCSTSELNQLVVQTDTVICRSGYSTIMDLFQCSFAGKIILIPTPGQTEQEYLASYLAKKYEHITTQTQTSFLKSLK